MMLFLHNPFKSVLPSTAQNGHLDYNCIKIVIKCKELRKTRNSYINLLLDKFATHV
jgi:hypothetical protein